MNFLRGLNLVSAILLGVCGAVVGGAQMPKKQVNADGFAGVDVGARIVAAQGAGGPAVISVNRAGTIASAFTLGAGEDLLINAPVSFAAVVTLAGGNRITCSKTGSINVVKGSAFHSTGDNLRIDHCRASGDGTFFAQLLTTKGASHVTIADNVLASIGTIGAADGADLEISGNEITWPALSTGYGAIWGGTNDVRFEHNTCTNVADCAEFFNADADFNKGGPNSRAGVLAHAGRYLISENRCVGSVACYWGSVGHDIVVSGNYASHCNDVCYDVEGSIDATFTGNRGDTSTNGIGAVFFFSDHNSFVKNDFHDSAGGRLIGVFNSSRQPRLDEFLTVSGNTLTCFNKPCIAFGGDPAADVRFENNHLTNAYVSYGGFSGNASIAGNDLTFSIAASQPFDAIWGPNPINGGVVEITGNTVKGVNEPANSSCIHDEQNDFNSMVLVKISKNVCAGGFPVDLRTVNFGANLGTGVTTVVSGNTWGHNMVIHTHKTGNIDRYSADGR